MDIGLIEALQPFDKSFKPLALEAGTVRFGDFPVRKTHAFTRRSRNRGRTTILKLDSKQRNTQSGKPTTTSAPGAPEGRGRDEDFSSPPAQIPACAANAPGSSLGVRRCAMLVRQALMAQMIADRPSQPLNSLTSRLNFSGFSMNMKCAPPSFSSKITVFAPLICFPIQT